MSITFPLTWQPNDTPTTPQGIFATGRFAKQLVERVIQLPEVQQQRLKVVTSQHHFIVLGSYADLPWGEKSVLIAPSVQTTKLWLPIHEQLTLPHGLVERALTQQFKRQPLLLLPSSQKVLPLDNQWRLTLTLRNTLTRLHFD